MEICLCKNKLFITGPKGNSKFCFPEAKRNGTFRVEGQQDLLFPLGPVIKCFVSSTNSKIGQTDVFPIFELVG